MNIKNRFYYILIFAIPVFWGGGCADADIATKPQSLDKPVSQEPLTQVQSRNMEKTFDSFDINVCRKELDVLKRLNIPNYNVRKKFFDKLMSGAKLYGDVRSDIHNSARSMVDALFTYKVEKLCADISQDVLNGLSRIGENSDR